MGWNALLMGCVAHLALLQTGEAECTLDRKVNVLKANNNNLKYGMACKETGEFLTTLNFRVESSALAITMEESSLCFVRGCCTSSLYSLRRTISCSVDYEDEDPIKIGDSVGGKCSCKDSESGIADTTARCDRFIRDGSGWNLVAAKSNETLCEPCQGGSQLVKDICQPCDEGSYSDETGMNKCKPCGRGRYTAGGGASECLYCPAGHTTYTHTPNTCVGPQLEGLDRTKRNTVFSVRVGYDTLGSEEGKAVFWGSIGNWKLFKSNRKSSFAIIKEKFTISFPKPKGPRFLIKRRVTGFEPIIEDVYCYTGDGSNYEGNENKTKSGSMCTGPRQHCTGGVCYCRNFRGTHGHKKPYCETKDGAEEDCDIPKCNDQDPSFTGGTGCSYDQYDTSETLVDSDNPIEFWDIASAQKICDKLGGECKGVLGKGNKWRVTGLSPTEQGTGSYEFHRKDPHCPNPYHEYYFKQIHEG